MSSKSFHSFEKNSSADSFYKPGIFWKSALAKIEKQFNQDGICKFRSNKTNLSFFVPTYGYQEMVLMPTQLQSFIFGRKKSEL